MARVRVKRSGADPAANRRSLAGVVAAVAAAFYFLLPLVFTSAGLDTFRLPKAAFAAAAIGWIGVAFFLTREFQPKPGWHFRWDGLLTIALLYALIHTLVVGGWGDSGRALLWLMLFVLLLFVLRASLNYQRQRQVWWALLSALTIDGVLTMAQYYRLFGDWSTEVGRSLGERFTPAGLIGNVNTGGLLFAIGIVMLAALVVTAGSRAGRGAAVAMLVVQAAALAHTRTLTAVLVLCLCGAAGFGFYNWWLVRYFSGAQRRRRLRLGWAVAVAAVSLGLVALSQTGTTARIARSLHFYGEGNFQRFASGRMPLFEVTWAMIEEAPLAGRGLDRFGREFFYFKTRDEAGRAVRLSGHRGAFREAHNEYLQAWVELGLAGPVLLAALLLWPLVRLPSLIQREEDPDKAVWMACLGLSVVGLMVSSLSFFPLHLAVTAAVAVLVLACLLRQQDDEESSRPRTLAELAQALGRPGFAITAVILVLISGWWTWRQVNRWSANRELSIAAGILEESAAGRVPADRRTTFVAEARRRIERAERWDPANSEALPLKGSAAFLSGRFEQAVAAYQEAARVLPSPEMLTNLAVAHLAAGDVAQARRILQEALAYNPRYPRAIQALELVEQREAGR